MNGGGLSKNNNERKKKQQLKTGKSNIKFINYCLKFKYMNKILMIYKLPTDGSSIKFKRYSLFRDEIHLTTRVHLMEKVYKSFCRKNER